VSVLVGVLLAVLGVLAVLLVAWCVGRARRLDRLHVRLDAARAALSAALDRRAGVARCVGVPAPAPVAEDSDRLRPAGRGRPGRVGVAGGAASVLAAREAGESALTRRLARIDRARMEPALRAELVDAEQLVVLARRVHNDAVRDTLALRSRRLVRWLRLAGTAARPVYFDIAEPEPDVNHAASATEPG